MRTVRDRALLIFGMACCLCRSELVALDATDLERLLEGLCVTVRRSKTDQKGEWAWSPCPTGGSCGPWQRWKHDLPPLA